MRIAGNTVPVRLRRDPNGGPKLLCPSGSQRLGAALQEAFALGEADNTERIGIAPMQQAHKWAEALDTIYGGERKAFIAATGRGASVVSRTLALAKLPNFVLACCSDVEALTPWFAEQLAPRLAETVVIDALVDRVLRPERLKEPIANLLDDSAAATRERKARINREWCPMHHPSGHSNCWTIAVPFAS